MLRKTISVKKAQVGNCAIEENGAFLNVRHLNVTISLQLL